MFRKTFSFPSSDTTRWFPGHMAKGMRVLKQKLHKVDCVIEVHDARIPISGRNPLFKQTLGIKPHLLVLNKMDLAEEQHRQRMLTHLNKQGYNNVLYTNCKQQYSDSVRRLMPAMLDIISNSDRYNLNEKAELCVMVIGVANVGKSSLINALRRHYLKKGKAARVGKVAGVTRSVSGIIKVSETPMMYLMDTPGVMDPHIDNVEVGMKLALCGNLHDHLVGQETIADYLLFKLNQQLNFSYVRTFSIEKPCDDILLLLKHIAVKILKKTQKHHNAEGNVILQPDFQAAAMHMLRLFREGQLGDCILDDVTL